MSETQPKIEKLHARQILDSRGNPTVEVEVSLANCRGRAAVPSGASTGQFEALELRDNNKEFNGKGVHKAINNVLDIIQPALIGQPCDQQENIDKLLLEIDGTENKSRCGANAILGVSMACAVAAAKFHSFPLYYYLNKESSIMPIPMINVPCGANSFSDAIRMGTEIFHTLKKELNKNGLNTTVGDEGGFAPALKSNEQAIELLLEAINKSGYSAGENVFIALDVAASSFYKEGKYHLSLEKKILDDEQMINFYENLINQYPIVSIEDGLDENDWSGWTKITEALGNSTQIVGDDLTVTNPKKLLQAVEKNAMNSILIKLNQIGTVSETIETINIAKENGYDYIISHRSGETEDTFIADLSVAMGGGQIKTGSVCRTDRTSKYNQLLRIEEKLTSKTFGKNFSFIK